MAVRSFYPGASRSRESLRVLSMRSGQNTVIKLGENVSEGAFSISVKSLLCKPVFLIKKSNFTKVPIGPESL